MIPRPPISTRTDTLFPYTTLVRSVENCYTYISRFNNGEWTEPEKLTTGVNMDGYRSFHPFVSADGKYFLFASDRPGGSGESDIWYSRSEEHTSELQSIMRISYAVFCMKKKKEYLTLHQKKNK